MAHANNTAVCNMEYKHLSRHHRDDITAHFMFENVPPPHGDI